MNFIKKAFSLFICLSCVLFTLNAQSQSHSGAYMCEQFENYLIRRNCIPQKIDIISNSSNEFAYNIAVDFVSKDQRNDDHLIICISMDQAARNTQIINNLLTDLEYRNFSSTVLFVYDLSRKFMRVRTYNGIENYLKTLDTSKNTSALILKLEGSNTELISSGWNYTAPSWMLSNGFDAFIQNGLSDYLPLYYLSNLSGSFFNSESYFSDFSNQNIPAISFSFKKDEVKDEVISNTITSYIDLYELSNKEDNDYHSLLYRIGNKKILFSEYSIIKALIIIMIISLFFIFILSFINSNLRNSAWEDIRKDWYSIPITLILTIGAFYIAKGIYNATNKNAMAGTPFGLVVFQILLSFALVSIFYWVEVSVRKKDYGEKSIDILVLLVTFVNQFIFCLSDISIFPLFMIICLCSTLSFILKKNWFHIILFVIMILIYLPYIILVYHTGDSFSLRFMISRSHTLIFALSFILLPIYLMWFRILTAIRKRITKKRHFAIIISSNYLLFFLLLIIPNYTAFGGKQTNISYPKITTITENVDSKIKVEHISKKVLGDSVETVYIETPMQADAILLQITGDTLIPVLYSDEEYTIDNTKTVSFKIPSYPPKQMTFSFGSTGSNFTIHAEAYYRTPHFNQYDSYVKEIKSGDE